MKTETKKVILFDIYQTLVDIDIDEKNSKENKAKAWDNFAKLLGQNNINITPTKLIELTNKKRANFYKGKDKTIYHHNFCDIMGQVIKEDLGADIPQEEVCSLIYEYRKISRGHARLYFGVIETLIQLKEKYILAVASYTQGCFTKPELKELGIDKFFSYFIFTSDVGLHKASPKFYEHCLEVVGKKAEDCVMVGDNYDVDVVIPQKLGIKAIWVKNSLTASQYTHLFDKKLENMINLKEFIKLPEIIKQILTLSSQ